MIIYLVVPSAWWYSDSRLDTPVQYGATQYHGLLSGTPFQWNVVWYGSKLWPKKNQITLIRAESGRTGFQWWCEQLGRHNIREISFKKEHWILLDMLKTKKWIEQFPYSSFWNISKHFPLTLKEACRLLSSSRAINENLNLIQSWSDI